MSNTQPETLDAGISSWRIGPYHAGMSGPIRFGLRIDGEIISAVDVEHGFLHRGLEKAMELHSWQAAVAYADHLDPEGETFGELALCLAVEEAGQIPVPPRAQIIRIMLCELTRISVHLGYIARMARAVDANTAGHYALRERERILDLFELLSGARFSLNFLRFGGVGADVTEGFIERVVEFCDLMLLRLKEYNDLFTFNHAFLKRTVRIGVLTGETIRRYGITGPNARASGFLYDIRKENPYSGYEKMDFTIPAGKGEKGVTGDAHDRFLLRLREVGQSVEILRQTADAIVPGQFCNGRVDKDFTILSGEAYSRIESARGRLGCHVVSDGGGRPARVQYNAPSAACVAAMTELLPGARIEDLPVIVASLDISISEVDK
ncbi:MAG: hypothetical protein A2583_06530 [Bdellovibrionales bacterium RIFOXYD1_FULL_53_11]|nr:MAG: hypothetical protein A2583_06530 [Bdellovibrionales bacterium RIFOXYD1_FULL_53_11]